jgi:hypothetical protein
MDLLHIPLSNLKIATVNVRHTANRPTFPTSRLD